MGIVYKIDPNTNQRQSNNIEGYFTDYPFLKITQGSLNNIGASRGDILHYSDNDLEWNANYEIILAHTDTFCEVKKWP